MHGKLTRGIDIKKVHGSARMPGLTNGLTNGLNVRTLRNSSEKEKEHGKILVEPRGLGRGRSPILPKARGFGRGWNPILAIAVLCFLVLGVFAVLTYQSQQRNTIAIDGNFDDWQGVAKESKERLSDVPENIDIAEYASTESGKNVAFYAKVYGNMLYGDGRYIVEAPSENPVYVAENRENAIPNVNGRDVAYVFIDTDNNANTGFKPSEKFAVGADRAIEILGKNGKIEASRVLEFAGTVPYEWNWVVKQSVDSATNGKQLETMASKSVLGIGEKYAVYFYMVDWQGKECKVENALKCENAKVNLFGLYLAEQATVRTESISMEIKGTAHGPIHINGNGQFTSANGVTGGSGTQSNPYIIENWDIDGNGGTYCIWIENTTAWFVIRNCNLWNATNIASEPWGTGIYLKNVTNGALQNNNCSGNFNGGIYLDSSSNNNITNNNCSGNSYDGMLLWLSSNNTITGNNCSGNSNQGIFIESSSNNTLSNNTCSDNSNVGIYLKSVSNSTLLNNTCSGNSIGISVYYSSNNNTITNNNCSANYNHGMCIQTSSSNNTVAYNYFYSNTKYAINITFGASNNLIYHNNFYQNNGAGKGVNGNCQAYDEVGGNTWYDNTAHEGNYWSNWDGNGWGTPSAYPIAGGAGAYDMYPLRRTHGPIHINGNADFANQASANGWPGNGTQGNPYIIGGYVIDGNGGTYCIWIENTDVWFVLASCKLWNATNTGAEPYGSGIYLKNVTNGAIENNNCSGNSKQGIYLNTTSNITIANNIARNNGDCGFYLYASSYNTIINNTAEQNGGVGIYLWHNSCNNIIDNNTANNNQYGIALYDGASSNNITNNTANNNSIQGIRLVGNSINNLICGNTANYNGASSSADGNGIHLQENANNNIIANNVVNYNKHKGISLWTSNNNITNNNCSENSYGIYLIYSTNNIITNNNFYHNTNYAIYILSSSTGNIIHHNYFYQNNGAGRGVNGNCQAYDSGTGNIWYDNTAQEGNYWSNWDGNGWGTPSAYPIAGGAGAYDMYPLRRTHGPIHINGNADFANQASANGWPGNGTQGNPYIIGGYVIDGNGGTYCIWIENTDVWFVLASCKLWNATNTGAEPYGSGIYLKNVTNGAIENNNCSGNSKQGIYLNTTSNITIANNIARNNGDCGFYLYASSYNTIINNTAEQNGGVGIYLWHNSCNNIIDNNTANNNQYGIALYDGASSNNITNNTANNNSIQGIRLVGNSINNLIFGNTANYNGASSPADGNGIHLENANNNIIANNVANYNKHKGISLWTSSNNNITNNNCSGNSYGIYLYRYSSNNNITNNNFYHNTNYAIYITSGSTGNIIHHNNFWQNNGASKGVNGNCQAYDNVGGNYWYDNTAQEGNYWSNWDGNGWGTPSAYPIAGGAGAYDMYPLSSPTPELSPLAVLVVAIVMLGTAVILGRRSNPHGK